MCRRESARYVQHQHELDFGAEGSSGPSVLAQAERMFSNLPQMKDLRMVNGIMLDVLRMVNASELLKQVPQNVSNSLLIKDMHILNAIVPSSSKSVAACRSMRLTGSKDLSPFLRSRTCTFSMRLWGSQSVSQSNFFGT